MGNERQELSENTLVSIGFVILIGSLVFWATTVYNATQGHAQAIQEIKAEQKTYTENHQRILRKLSRIQGKLGIDDAER